MTVNPKFSENANNSLRSLTEAHTLPVHVAATTWFGGFDELNAWQQHDGQRVHSFVPIAQRVCSHSLENFGLRSSVMVLSYPAVDDVSSALKPVFHSLGRTVKRYGHLTHWHPMCRL